MVTCEVEKTKQKHVWCTSCIVRQERGAGNSKNIITHKISHCGINLILKECCVYRDIYCKQCVLSSADEAMSKPCCLLACKIFVCPKCIGPEHAQMNVCCLVGHVFISGFYILSVLHLVFSFASIQLQYYTVYFF